ncbi:hypothetical protein D3C81_2283920 [compost metagenome]
MNRKIQGVCLLEYFSKHCTTYAAIVKIGMYVQMIEENTILLRLHNDETYTLLVQPDMPGV